MIRSFFDRNARKRVPASKPLLMQWHITERCNLRCSHCYQQAWNGDELDFGGLLDIFEQFKRLQESFRSQPGETRHGQVTVTGGEPFLRDDLFSLLEVLHANKPRISFAVLTNGTLIDRLVARRLRALHPRFVQVSIEGNAEIHDAIRGKASFAMATRGVKELVAERIPVLISFTAHRMNYGEFPAVAELACRLGVRRVWADRMIPVAGGAKLESLSREQTHEFVSLIKKARDRVQRRWFGRTEVAMHRALQFLEGGGTPYHCNAGDSLITVQPNGDLYPCRRLPIRIGNLTETCLEELYQQSTTLKELRNVERTPSTCAACAHAHACRGGLRCLSLAVSGDPYQRDPGCWLHHPEEKYVFPRVSSIEQ